MVKKEWKVSILLCSLVFSLFFLFSLSIVAFSSDEFTRSVKGNVSGEIKKFDLYTPSNLGGKVIIRTGQNNVCLVDFQCRARARNRKMAEEFTELVEMRLDVNNQIATLRLTTPGGAPWEETDYGIWANLEIYVPPGIVVETRTRQFHLDITGPLKQVFVENDYGEIKVIDVSEKTSISGTYNKVEVEELQGRVDIETSYNSIRAVNIDTKGEMASFETDYANIEVRDFTGQLNATSSYSRIFLSHLNLIDGRNEIRNMHGKIDLQLERMENSRLQASNTYGNIDIQAPQDLSARLLFTVGRGGKIQTNRILIRPLVLQKTKLEGICGDGDSEIELDIEGIGSILLEGR